MLLEFIPAYPGNSITPKTKSLSSVNRRARQNKSPIKVDNNPIQPFLASIRFKKMIRYSNSANAGSSNQTITRGNLLNSMIVNLSGSTSNARLVAAVKVNRVEIYTAVNPASAGTFFTASVEWLSEFGPSNEVSTSSIGSAAVGHLVSTPPPQSLASFWSLTGSSESTVIMRLIANTSVVIDVYYEFVMMDDETPVTVTTTASGTTGQFSITRLDGPSAGAIYVPLSYITLN